ncbi:hypothetical protein Krac_10912 [Ktedonobacter racemifer DSM 44963]|uniref:Uncharacterized protein n=1 Tax=Ktedonobacter racemifer DSM 44963 TaxID=485913 RepID=D6TIV5_KTERA|nr:hypothetical protein Krac_10912 [Ktedonobacter racemifer DSM 44963]
MVFRQFNGTRNKPIEIYHIRLMMGVEREEMPE